MKEPTGRDGEVVLLLEATHHATEVLTDEVLEELRTGVTLLGVGELLEDLVREFSASLEGELLGQDEGVVTVEQDLLDDWHVDGCYMSCVFG